MRFPPSATACRVCILGGNPRGAYAIAASNGWMDGTAAAWARDWDAQWDASSALRGLASV